MGKRNKSQCYKIDMHTFFKVGLNYVYANIVNRYSTKRYAQ